MPFTKNSTASERDELETSSIDSNCTSTRMSDPQPSTSKSQRSYKKLKDSRRKKMKISELKRIKDKKLLLKVRKYVQDYSRRDIDDIRPITAYYDGIPFLGISLKAVPKRKHWMQNSSRNKNE